MRVLTTCLAAGLLALTACNSSSKQHTASAPRLSDSNFLRTASQAQMKEIELARIARDRAVDDDVREFARHMIDDHSANLSRLRTIASDEGVSLAESLDSSGRYAADNLSSMSGRSLDRRYMEMSLDDHREAIDLFERQAQSGENARVRRFAEDSLPTLRHHMTMARATAEDADVYAYPRDTREYDRDYRNRHDHDKVDMDHHGDHDIDD